MHRAAFTMNINRRILFSALYMVDIYSHNLDILVIESKQISIWLN